MIIMYNLICCIYLVIASVHYSMHACETNDRLFAKFVLNWTTCDVIESWGWLVLQDQ